MDQTRPTLRISIRDPHWFELTGVRLPYWSQLTRALVARLYGRLLLAGRTDLLFFILTPVIQRGRPVHRPCRLIRRNAVWVTTFIVGTTIAA